MPLSTPPPDPSKPRLREQPASLREPTAARMVRWRIRLLMFSIVEILLAQILVLAFLPTSARLFDIEVVCIAFVLLGAAPVAASLFQYSLIGFHRFRMKYERLRPYYPRTAVIVPAWNEGQVVGSTIEHLLGMEYPAERLRVVVVDDASTDNTPDVVRAKMAEHPGRVVHLRRLKGGEGKAHTLNYGIANVLSDDWAEAVLIIDADVLFEHDALRKMTRHLSDPEVGAVTAYIKEGTEDGNYLTRFIAYEYITAQAAARRAQNVLGVLACLAGGAQLHSRENLEAMGGRIDTSSLAEDTVTTFKTQIHRRRVEFEGNAVVWAEEPSELVGLWKQRIRWGRGNVQISLQYLSIWGRNRSAFEKLGSLPFVLLWFTVLLMPALMFGASAGLLTLYMIGSTMAWSVFEGLWIWHAIAYVFGTAMALSIDPQTAKRCWREAILFPGIISLFIMLYSVYPALYEVHLVGLLQQAGVVFTARHRALFTLMMYSWLFLCIPFAYLAKVWSETPRLKWLAPLTIYLIGYGPFLCAVTFGSYVKELRNVSATWDKTVKSGRVVLGAARPR
jgi:cellulose synthase/poly-beta-1,6-N-acetylglucosamine synthase-like glycosyltransferase